jgi:hypothetical protein
MNRNESDRLEDARAIEQLPALIADGGLEDTALAIARLVLIVKSTSRLTPSLRGVWKNHVLPKCHAAR